MLEALDSDGDRGLHPEGDVGVAKGNPVGWDVPKIGGLGFDVVHAHALDTQLGEELFPVSGGHATGKEPNQVVVLGFGEVVCHRGKGLPRIVGNVFIGEIMVEVLSFHGSFKGWLQKGLRMSL